MKTTIKSILSAFVLTVGLTACGNTDGLTKEELGENESAVTVPHCQVTSQTNATETGYCYNGNILREAPCVAGANHHGTPTLAGTLSNGQQVWVDNLVCGF